jgi:hypothetical protein
MYEDPALRAVRIDVAMCEIRGRGAGLAGVSGLSVGEWRRRRRADPAAVAPPGRLER